MKKNIADAGKIDIEALKATILALESPKKKRERERIASFAELYEAIREQIRDDVAKSLIIKALADAGMSISNPIFDKLLADEAKRRGEPVPRKDDEAGEGVPPSANQPLHRPPFGQKEEVIA